MASHDHTRQTVTYPTVYRTHVSNEIAIGAGVWIRTYTPLIYKPITIQPFSYYRIIKRGYLNYTDFHSYQCKSEQWLTQNGIRNDRFLLIKNKVVI